MFIFKPVSDSDMEAGLYTAANYGVTLYPKLYRGKDRNFELYFIIRGIDSLDGNAGANERLAEMAFQAGFTQAKGCLCIHCRKQIEETGEGEATCGHLTFERVT